MAALAPLLRMSAAVFVRSDRREFLSERMVMFFTFACGSMLAAWDLVPVPALPPMRVLSGVFLALILFLAASGFGLLFLPAGMLLFGIVSEKAVLSLYAATEGKLFLEPLQIAMITLLVPPVFLTCLHGFCAASSLRTALFRASPSARSRYQSELLETAFFALVSLAVVFYFT